MKIKTNLYFCILALAAVVLLGAPLVAKADVASHPTVTLLDVTGTAITGGATPYSPKMTCSEANTCHTAGGVYADMKTGVSTTFTGPQLVAIHSYGTDSVLSTHVQGALGADNKVYWQASSTKSYKHGVSVGRHMEQGRNEDYSNTTRVAVGDPIFTSSLGMWGKY